MAVVGVPANHPTGWPVGVPANKRVTAAVGNHLRLSLRRSKGAPTAAVLYCPLVANGRGWRPRQPTGIYCGRRGRQPRQIRVWLARTPTTADTCVVGEPPAPFTTAIKGNADRGRIVLSPGREWPWLASPPTTPRDGQLASPSTNGLLLRSANHLRLSLRRSKGSADCGRYVCGWRGRKPRHGVKRRPRLRRKASHGKASSGPRHDHCSLL